MPSSLVLVRALWLGCSGSEAISRRPIAKSQSSQALGLGSDAGWVDDSALWRLGPLPPLRGHSEARRPT
eukprot:377539-Alexandrium_andersonii.AAC.1